MHRSSTIYKQNQSKIVLIGQNMYVDFDVSGQQEMNFFTGGSVMMDYGIFWSVATFEVKMP